MLTEVLNALEDLLEQLTPYINAAAAVLCGMLVTLAGFAFIVCYGDWAMGLIVLGVCFVCACYFTAEGIDGKGRK
jgi:hypothetical protein